MRVIALDTETTLIRPGAIVPDLVCVSYQAKGDALPSLLDRHDGPRFAAEVLADPRVLLVGHNLAYDLAVLAKARPSLMRPIFAAMDAGRIRDTKVREQLLCIARGTLKISDLSLAGLSKRWLGETLEKEDTYRLRYGELINTPLAAWPAEARTYALKDAETTLRVYLAQGEQEAPDEANQVRAAWALHLMSAWGIRTDGELIAAGRASRRAAWTEAMQAAAAAGVAKRDGKKGFSRNMKAIKALVAAAYSEAGVEIPRTETGQIETSEEVLEWTKDPNLALVAKAVSIAKEDAYLAALETGAGRALTAKFGNLVETGRTSCSAMQITIDGAKVKEGTNLQNPPRSGGIRECVVPRKGNVFCSVDFDAAELASLGQVQLTLLGRSKLADAINAGLDPHLDFAAEMLHIPYAEAKARKSAKDPLILERRQMAKAADFGLPGGMGVDNFIAYAWTAYRVRLTYPEAKALRDFFFRKWPEMQEYFRLIKAWLGPAGEGSVIQLVSGRVRGRVYFTQAANSMFQGLTADGAKRALYLLTRACYAEPFSILYGCRPVLFLHDEIITEMPEAIAAEAAAAMAAIMIAAMREFTPDVACGASPALMRRWYKGAEAVTDASGRLIPWEPAPPLAA